MSQPNCEGADGLVCVGGYLYSLINMMIFPTNRKCPHCNPEPPKAEQPSLRGIEGAAIPLRILIEAIPHKQQRYDTCGDYHYGEDRETLWITISQLPSRREMLLVAIHELIEWALCESEGISNEEIDKFDKDDDFWALIAAEPGDCIQAPYYKQHQIATGIERILAAEMGVDWLEYERHIEELSK